MRLVQLLLNTFALVVPPTAASAQVGKIAGTVQDAGTGQTMPGVNVAVGGTTQGAVTDADVFYNIPSVRPGEYNVRASFILLQNSTAVR